MQNTSGYGSQQPNYNLSNQVGASQSQMSKGFARAINSTDAKVKGEVLKAWSENLKSIAETILKPEFKAGPLKDANPKLQLTALFTKDIASGLIKNENQGLSSLNNLLNNLKTEIDNGEKLTDNEKETLKYLGTLLDKTADKSGLISRFSGKTAQLKNASASITTILLNKETQFKTGHGRLPAPPTPQRASPHGRLPPAPTPQKSSPHGKLPSPPNQQPQIEPRLPNVNAHTAPKMVTIPQTKQEQQEQHGLALRNALRNIKDTPEGHVKADYETFALKLLNSPLMHTMENYELEHQLSSLKNIDSQALKDKLVELGYQKQVTNERLPPASALEKNLEPIFANLDEINAQMDKINALQTQIVYSKLPGESNIKALSLASSLQTILDIPAGNTSQLIEKLNSTINKETDSKAIRDFLQFINDQKLDDPQILKIKDIVNTVSTKLNTPPPKLADQKAFYKNIPSTISEIKNSILFKDVDKTQSMCFLEDAEAGTFFFRESKTMPNVYLMHFKTDKGPRMFQFALNPEAKDTYIFTIPQKDAPPIKEVVSDLKAKMQTILKENLPDEESKSYEAMKFTSESYLASDLQTILDIPAGNPSQLIKELHSKINQETSTKTLHEFIKHFENQEFNNLKSSMVKDILSTAKDRLNKLPSNREDQHIFYKNILSSTDELKNSILFKSWDNMESLTFLKKAEVGTFFFRESRTNPGSYIMHLKTKSGDRIAQFRKDEKNPDIYHYALQGNSEEQSTGQFARTIKDILQNNLPSSALYLPPKSIPRPDWPANPGDSLYYAQIPDDKKSSTVNPKSINQGNDAQKIQDLTAEINKIMNSAKTSDGMVAMPKARVAIGQSAAFIKKNIQNESNPEILKSILKYAEENPGLNILSIITDDIKTAVQERLKELS